MLAETTSLLFTKLPIAWRHKLTLNCRLDELEDRSPRNNVIFHGIPDLWETSLLTGRGEKKKKPLPAFSSALGSNFPPNAVEHTHQLSTFSNTKCRPTIMTETISNTKKKILSLSPKLKENNISVLDNFAPGTWHARKKTVGIRQGEPHSPTVSTEI